MHALLTAENDGRKRRSIESIAESIFKEKPDSSEQHSWKKESQASTEVGQNTHFTSGEFKFKGIAVHILKTWVYWCFNNQVHKK